MGQPVVHFEVIGKDGAALRSFYSDLFGWKIDANNPMNYGIVQREGNVAPDGTGIGGGVGVGPEGYDGHVTFYIGVSTTSRRRSPRQRAWAERAMMGPEKVMETIEIGQFTDPEGHLIGVVKARVAGLRAQPEVPRRPSYLFIARNDQGDQACWRGTAVFPGRCDGWPPSA